MNQPKTEVANERPAAKVADPDGDEPDNHKHHEGEVDQQHQVGQQ